MDYTLLNFVVIALSCLVSRADFLLGNSGKREISLLKAVSDFRYDDAMTTSAIRLFFLFTILLMDVFASRHIALLKVNKYLYGEWRGPFR